MRNPFTILSKLFKKGLAAILLSALAIFACVYNVLFFVYRLVAVVLSAIGASMVAVDCYKYGFTAERGLIFLALGFAIALRYLLPLLVPVMQRWLADLKDYIHAPVIVKSPVRYTI